MTLAERARALKNVSKLMEGRNKLETRDHIGEKLTITAADIINPRGDSGAYAVVVFKEYPDHFLFAGTVLTQLIQDLTTQLEAEGLDLNEELQKPGEAVVIRMSTKQGKSGKFNYTDVEVM